MRVAVLSVHIFAMDTIPALVAGCRVTLAAKRTGRMGGW